MQNRHVGAGNVCRCSTVHVSGLTIYLMKQNQALLEDSVRFEPYWCPTKYSRRGRESFRRRSNLPGGSEAEHTGRWDFVRTIAIGLPDPEPRHYDLAYPKRPHWIESQCALNSTMAMKMKKVKKQYRQAYSLTLCCCWRRLLPSRSIGIWKKARQGHLFPRHDVNEEIELVRLAEGLGNVRPWQSPPFVWIGNNKGPGGNFWDKY